MKKLILAALVSAGALLAQSGGATSNTSKAPANTGVTSNSGASSNGSSSAAKPAVKKHHKGNKPATATKPANGASTGTQSGSAASKTPAPATK